jgi:hypothetical protein
MIKEKDVWKEGKREMWGNRKVMGRRRGIEHGQIFILDFYFFFFYLIKREYFNII